MMSQLTSALFYKDTAGKMDNADPAGDDDAVNHGLKKRHEFTKNSKVVDLIGPIHSDIFFQDRHMLNGVDVKLKLIRSSNAFCLRPLDPTLTTKWSSLTPPCLSEK